MSRLTTAKTKIFFFVKVAVAILLIAFLIWAFDWAQVWQRMKTMNPFFVFLYALSVSAGLWISAEKWRRISGSVGFDGSSRGYLRRYWSGMFINNFFPGFLGGDVYRIFSLSDGTNGSLARASLTVVIDRFSGLLATLLLAFLAAAAAAALGGGRIYLLSAVVAAALLAAAAAAAGLSERLKKASFLPAAARKYLEIFSKGFSFDGEVFSKIMFFSLFFALVGVGAANYFLFLAAGEALSPLRYAAVVFPISVFLALPISVGNIGTKEAAYVFAFAFLGVSAEASLAVVLVGRLVQMLISLPAAFFLKREDLWYNQKKENNRKL